MTVLHYVVFVMFPIGMAFAAASDLLTMTISNRLVIALAAAFFVAAPLAGIGIAALGLHIVAAAAVLLVAFLCFAMGWIGGGDAKLASVIVLWLGAEVAVSYVLLASIFGGVLTFLLLVFRRQEWPAFIIGQPWVQRLHDQRSGVPYGIALAGAALSIYPRTQWMQLLAG